VKSW
jgi:hypothetical protein